MTEERPPDPAPAPAVSSPQRGQPAGHPFAHAPLLAVLAALASFVDTFVSRLAAPAIAPRAGLPVTKLVFAVGDVAMNLAAVAGLVALSIILIEALRRQRFGSLFHRLTIAGFAGVFLPSIALSTILPRTRTTPQLVIFATGAAFVLVILFGTSALLRRSPIPARIAVTLVTAGAAAGLGAMFCAYAPWLNQHAMAERVGLWLVDVAEIAWLATPVAVAVLIRPDPTTARGRAALGSALVAGALLSLVFRVLRGLLRRQFSDLLYYAFRVQLMVEAAPVAYTIAVTLVVMVAVLALLASEPWRRQLGAALLLLTAAGVTPRMPGTLLMFVLGTMLLGRVAIALSPGALDAPANDPPDAPTDAA